MSYDLKVTNESVHSLDKLMSIGGNRRGGGGLISGSFQVVDMFDVAHVLNNQANQFCTLY